MPSVNDFQILAASFAESDAVPHFHRIAFKVRKKIFASLDEEKGIAVLKLNEIDQSAFCAFDAAIVYPVAGAWGKQGWTEVVLSTVPHEMLTDLITTAYCTVAPKKLATQYRPT